MPLPRLVRNLAHVLARTVGQNDLFERPGERPPTPPLAPRATPQFTVAAAAAPEAAAAKAAKPGKASRKAAAAVVVAAERPTTGCVPVNLASLGALLTPSGKPLVVNHWATWCDPCVDELPRLVRAAAGVADIGEFVGLSWDLFDHPGEPNAVAKKVATFADSVGVGYGSLLFTGKPAELFSALGLKSELIPQTHVIAPNGEVVWSKLGIIDHDDVFPLIAAVKAAAGKG